MDGASLALQARLSPFLEEVDRTPPALIRPFVRRSLREHCLSSSLLVSHAPGACALR